MKNFLETYKDRRYDEMFYADDENISVDRVQAFTCPPNDDDTRWVPEKGYSVRVGYSVFKTAKEADTGLRRKLVKERELLIQRIAKIDGYLGEGKA